MAIKYEISRWDALTYPGKARAYHVAAQAPKAGKLLWAEIYAMLEARGLLDRPVAKRLESEFENCEISPPALGYMRSQVFYLNPDEKMGAQVCFSAMRV